MNKTTLAPIRLTVKGTPSWGNIPKNLTAQSYLIAALTPAQLCAGVLWYIPSSHDITPTRELWKFWSHYTGTTAQLLTFPDDFTIWLWHQQSQNPTILVIAHEHLDLSLPNAKQIMDATSTLRLKDIIKPLELLRNLEKAGYEPGPLPDSTGWFTKQGGIVTVCSHADTWIITFNDNTIERITKLNLHTNTPIKDLTHITILPRRLASDPTTTLASYLSHKHTLIATPPEIIPPSGSTNFVVNPLKPSTLFQPVPLFGKQWETIKEFLQKNPTTKIITSEISATKRGLTIPNENKNTTNSKPTLPDLCFIETPAHLSAWLEGFTDLATATTYLTDRELGFHKRPHHFRTLASFEQLTSGDYVVHIDHGIGYFRGLTAQTIDDLTRDYFVIEYAEEDKLFVPVEHTDRLSRYLGSPHPPVYRLHAAGWFQITKKVKAEANSLARELLKLYAKRQASKLMPWQHFAEEELLAASFPHALTSDQLKAWAEISNDLEQTIPMDRLICGDVGFGKTELAIRTAFRAVLNNHQVAILAPTTVLAQQHLDTLRDRLQTLGVKVELISRAQTTKEVKQILTELANGDVHIIIGTHRLLARDVHFKNLGLLIIDEEQRFGVKQKEELKALKPALHVLSLSATPIPRTLNLAISQVRELSIVATPPSGRHAVNTEFCPPDDNIIKTAILRELKRSGQIYYLVPHIADLGGAESRLKNLLPTLNIGTIHGRLSPKDITKVMHSFDEGEIDLLLATTIIENGIDLPNVNTMIVEDADQFGLADLYQLRGRVGRSSVQAYAYFLINDKRTAAADKRLEALAQAKNLGSGMTVALRDLELRGAGAILGREQHGQVAAVGLYLYAQLLTQAVEEMQTGEPMPTIPEVLLRLPLEGRISIEIVPSESHRLQMYQRLAAIREPSELKITAEEMLGRLLTDESADRLFKNLLTLLEIKLLAERARLNEVSFQKSDTLGKFSIKFLEPPSIEVIERLTAFDNRWRKVESSYQAEHMLAAGAWIPWLKESLKTLGK